MIESFRNDLWPGYKTGEGIDPMLLAQFHPLEEALAALGVVVWPMVEFEADDALAAAAAVAAADPRVARVLICTPDKDLAQCVRRRTRRAARPPQATQMRDEAGVDRRSSACRPRRSPTTSRWSATPPTAFPGLPGWGAKSAAAVLARYGHLEDIPAAPAQWDVPVRGAAGWPRRSPRSATGVLFRDLATLRLDAPTRRRRRRAALGRPDAGVRGVVRRGGDAEFIRERAVELARRRA